MQTLNNKVGYIDSTGEEIAPIIYDDALKAGDSIFWLKKGNKWGLAELSISD